MSDNNIDISADWLKLERVGKSLFGSSWQKDLSNALGIKDSANLRRFKSRGVPPATWDKVKVIAKDRINEITEILLEIV